MFSFLIKSDNFEESDLDLSVFQWMGIEDSEMQLIELTASSLGHQNWRSCAKKRKGLIEIRGPTLSTVGSACQWNLTVWRMLYVQCFQHLDPRIYVNRSFHTWSQSWASHAAGWPLTTQRPVCSSRSPNMAKILCGSAMESRDHTKSVRCDFKYKIISSCNVHDSKFQQVVMWTRVCVFVCCRGFGIRWGRREME